MNDIKNYDIKKLIIEKDLYSVRKFVENSSFEEIVEKISDLNDLEVSLFFRFLTTETASELFSYLDEEQQQSIIKNLTKKEIADFINELYTDEIADVLENLPPDMARTILLTVNKDTRDKVNKILKFGEDQVGSIMSVDIISLKNTLTNKEALNIIKKKREESEIGEFYYIVDSANKLQGYTILEDIVFNPKDNLVTDSMKVVRSIKTTQLKEEAAKIFASEDYSSLPVVDENGVLMGMITSSDIIDIIHEEASEDIYKAAGINLEAQSSSSYLKSSILSLVKSRVFWLLILMIGSTLSQLIIQIFSQGLEDKINEILKTTISSSVLIALIPVTSATSGNAGSQSTSTLTRAASLGEFKQNKIKEVLFKETMVGLILGLILAVANFARLIVYYMLYNGFLFDKTAFTLLISLTSSLSLFLSITCSKFLGSSILALAIKYKRDPAVMSAPLITTIIDALSTLIFFGLSYLILIPLLGS